MVVNLIDNADATPARATDVRESRATAPMRT